MIIPFTTTADQCIHLYKIAVFMSDNSSLSKEQIVAAVKIAEEYEGMYDLFVLWENEKDTKERKNIIRDIQEETEWFSLRK